MKDLEGRFLIVKVKLSDKEKDLYDFICDDENAMKIFFNDIEKYLHSKLKKFYYYFHDFIKYHKQVKSIADDLGAGLTHFEVL